MTSDAIYRARSDVKHALREVGAFRTGAHFIVDGQFGSTGKGLMASIYAEAGADLIDMVTTNAGPNSGHTAFSPVTGEKIMHQQIPIASRTLADMGKMHDCYLNAGAIIDPDILHKEARATRARLAIHPNAALIGPLDKAREGEPTSGPAKIASTGKGVGSAQARKIMREGNVAGKQHGWWSDYIRTIDLADYADDCTVLVETAQGFSLGVNGQFYPHTTSRECTTLQAAADARIPYTKIRKTIACYRTFPIRVGNTAEGFSGSHYPDQHETTWEAIGQEPELTSVTKRVRRVFSWSRIQFRESVAVNEPTVIFLNFANYLEEEPLDQLIGWVHSDYKSVIGVPLPLLLIGRGPYNGDVTLE